MKFYLAPLEGITGYIYRNALEKYFPGADRYFTPFIMPNQHKMLRTKELRDVLPENNRVPDLIPQILTNQAEHFLETARQLEEMGYQEVNLNLGCPSGTVVSKKRGSGLLAYPEELDRFLDEIFTKSPVRISIKSRIGRDSTEDAFRLMEIYRKYPLSELIIHPRTQKEYYRGMPDQALFGELARAYRCDDTAPAIDCSETSQNAEHSNFNAVQRTICYNGNLLTNKDYLDFTAKFPDIPAVMLGRGVIANPGLLRQIRTGIPTDRPTLRAFHDEILENYREAFGSDNNALFRMKELWIYMIHLFTDPDRYKKKIHKAQNLADYRCIVDALFREQTLLTEGPAQWVLPQK